MKKTHTHIHIIEYSLARLHLQVSYFAQYTSKVQIRHEESLTVSRRANHFDGPCALVSPDEIGDFL